MSDSRIEWTEKTWNPVTGCTPISPGCDHCYASRMAKRLAGRSGYPPAPHQFDVTCHPDRLAEPLHWRKPCRVFVCSMGDLFHDDVPGDFIDQVFAVMAACPQHTFQVLTKRPARMLKYLVGLGAGLMRDQSHHDYDAKRLRSFCNGAVRSLIDVIGGRHLEFHPLSAQWPLPNLWLGVTCEDQQRADERIPLLLQCPAAVRFVSCEPLLGEIDLYRGGWSLLRPLNPPPRDGHRKEHIDWVICGGETGPGARPMHPDWARSLRDQCAAAGVAFFLKSWGEYIPEEQNQPGAHQYCALHNPVPDGGFFTFPDGRKMHRVGKKRAGRLLDGVEYSEYPGADA